jgi:hypothetical protein
MAPQAKNIPGADKISQNNSMSLLYLPVDVNGIKALPVDYLCFGS